MTLRGSSCNTVIIHCRQNSDYRANFLPHLIMYNLFTFSLIVFVYNICPCHCKVIFCMYLFIISVYSICLQYQSTVSVYSICLQYQSTVSVYSICLQYLSTVSVYSICLQYLSTVSVYSICL